MAILRQILRPAVRIDWSQFEGAAALRCTVGVAIPLVAGLVFAQPSISAFGAVGAMSVGFGSFQGAYRSRAAVMVFAAFGMAISIFAGSLAGHSNLASIAAATLAAFASGLLVALGPSAAHSRQPRQRRHRTTPDHANAVPGRSHPSLPLQPRAH